MSSHLSSHEITEFLYNIIFDCDVNQSDSLVIREAIDNLNKIGPGQWRTSRGCCITPENVHPEYDKLFQALWSNYFIPSAEQSLVEQQLLIGNLFPVKAVRELKSRCLFDSSNMVDMSEKISTFFYRMLQKELFCLATVADVINREPYIYLISGITALEVVFTSHKKLPNNNKIYFDQGFVMDEKNCPEPYLPLLRQLIQAKIHWATEENQIEKKLVDVIERKAFLRYVLLGKPDQVMFPILMKFSGCQNLGAIVGHLHQIAVQVSQLPSFKSKSEALFASVLETSNHNKH